MDKALGFLLYRHILQSNIKNISGYLTTCLNKPAFRIALENHLERLDHFQRIDLYDLGELFYHHMIRFCFPDDLKRFDKLFNYPLRIELARYEPPTKGGDFLLEIRGSLCLLGSGKTPFPQPLQPIQGFFWNIFFHLTNELYCMRFYGIGSFFPEKRKQGIVE